MVIQRAFFPSVAEREAQLGLQRYYFHFMLIFIVLVTAISGSIISTAETLVKNPLAVFDILANRLPQSSHFYLNWFVLQWLTQVLGLLRYANLVKFNSILGGLNLIMSDTFKSRRAKYLSEPENTDCYGIGARSAETVLLLSVSMIFCSLVPIICLFAFITFGVVRIIYGYLLVYAETRKADLGGLFWCEQLQQLNTVMVIYVILMTGYFSFRASDTKITLFVFAALPYNFYRYYRFKATHRYDKIPVLNAGNGVDVPGKAKSPLPADSYVQPELRVTQTISQSSRPSEASQEDDQADVRTVVAQLSTPAQPPRGALQSSSSCFSGCLAGPRARLVAAPATAEPLVPPPESSIGAPAEAEAVEPDRAESGEVQATTSRRRTSADLTSWEEGEPGLGCPTQ